MRAVAIDYESRTLTDINVPEPEMLRDSEVLLKIVATGVCGTDRDLARFRFGFPPPGESRLILGHEAIAQVLAAGAHASGIAPGDWVAPMVRRACSAGCTWCNRGRVDLCISGQYTERGIMGAHGYFCEYAVDCARHLVPVPKQLADVAVLAEPLSVVEKAAALALRLHPGGAQTAAVLGAGTVGMLAALVLRQLGLDTFVYSAEPADSPRARLINHAEFRYTDRVDAAADIVIEATGAPAAANAGLQMLAPLGVLVILGAMHSDGDLALRDLIVGNRIIAGSVNAGPEDWRRGLEHLACFDRDVLRRMLHPMGFSEYRTSILGPPPDHPKVVHFIE